jgi:hypothetical protein
MTMTRNALPLHVWLADRHCRFYQMVDHLLSICYRRLYQMVRHLLSICFASFLTGGSPPVIRLLPMQITGGESTCSPPKSAGNLQVFNGRRGV